MKRQIPSRTQQDTEAVIASGERLTIETTAEFVQSIRRGLAGATTVVLEFKPDVEVDITALQVFCAACKTAAAEGKKFIYRGSLPPVLLDLAAAAGAELHEILQQ